jgi:hypothetical protein
MALFKDRMDAILLGTDEASKAVLDDAVRLCKDELQRMQPEFVERGLLDPLVAHDAAPWCKRVVVLAFVVYTDRVRDWVAAGCTRMRFEPFMFRLRDQLRVYGYDEASFGVRASAGNPPYYRHAIEFLVEMCESYRDEFDYEGQWNKAAREQGERNLFETQATGGGG